MRVALLGGYGDVGGRLARRLVGVDGVEVVIVGRDGERAVAAAARLGGRAVGRAVDVTAAAAAAVALSDVDVVVSLIEATPPELAGDLSRGALFVETSADPAYVDQVCSAVRDSDGAGVFNVGLCPGLTEATALDLAERYPTTVRLVTFLEMGMGQRHRAAAVEWSLRNVDAEWTARRDGEWVIASTADRRSDVVYLGDEKPRLAISYGFVDQVEVARRASTIATVETYLSLDPPWLTRSIARVAGTWSGRLLSRHARSVARLAPMLPTVGRDRVRLRQEAWDAEGEVIAALDVVLGADQAEVTAVMIVATLVAVRQDPIRARRGLRAMHELLSPLEIHAALLGSFGDLRWSTTR